MPRILLAIVFGALTFLSGCHGDSDGIPDRTLNEAPKSGGSIVALVASESAGNWASGLDPATNATARLNLSIMNAIFGGLFQLTADSDGSNPRIVGVLASGYEIADDGRKLIIHLRPDLLFSDGSPLDAEALRFNIERNLSVPCSCSPIRWPWADQDPVTVVDDDTVSLNFSRPYSAAIHSIPAVNINWPISPTAITIGGEDLAKSHPVGAGPFRIVKNQHNFRLELEKNPNYWQLGRPYLDQLIFQSIASEQAAYLSLLSGDAHVAEGITSTAIIKQALSNTKINVTQQPATAPYVIQLNTKTAPFNDERARRAIYLATDVETIRSGLFDNWYPISQSFTGPGGLFHHGRVPGYPEYDLESARELVLELGGLKVRLGTIRSFVAEQVVTALQTQWRDAGIDTTIETLEFGALVDQAESNRWQAILQTAGSYDPEAGVGVTFRFGTDQLFSGVSDSTLDSIFSAAAASTDEQERNALYLTAAQHISDRAYAPFLFAFAPTQFAVTGVSGPGLTSRIPPIAINTAIQWQDVRLVEE